MSRKAVPPEAKCPAIADVERLTLAWEAWWAQAANPARVIARSRLYLAFLLIRYGGLRLGEVFAVDCGRDIDRQTGYLRIGGQSARNIFLPLAAMRRIRPILALPEAWDSGFLRLDPGFARRTFYGIAAHLGIHSATSGPRAIRMARGLELLAMHMPLPLVLDFLGLSRPAQAAAFLKIVEARQSGACAPGGQGAANTFLARITSTRAGQRSIRLSLKTFSGLRLISICSIVDSMRLEPRIGQIVSASVIPDQIFISLEPFAGCPANFFSARVCSIFQEPIETFVRLELAHGDQLAAVLENEAVAGLALENNQNVTVYFAASAVRVAVEL